jgi:putative spermidine/putrescine transport system permease protein
MTVEDGAVVSSGIARPQRLRPSCLARQRLRPGAFVAPALLFLLVFFLLPICSFMLRAVDNSEVNGVIPRTISSLQDWSGSGPVPAIAYATLARELRAATDDTAVAQLARRLNYVVPGFRSVILKTRTRLFETELKDPTADLIAIAPQWAETHYWAALRNSGGAFTAYYFLSAFDLKRADDGHIVLAAEGERIFLGLFGRTLLMSFIITTLCIVIGFPVAQLLARARPAIASLMLFFVLLPFWTSLLVRSSAWVLLLQREGLLNNLLLHLGLIEQPLSLIYNRFGVYVSMTHVLLPFAILPLYAAMRPIPPALMRAASSLGANPFRAFVEVYLPQTFPGVAAASVLVFVLSVGYYITPALVGGPNDQMISSFIAFYTNISINWGLASALSCILLVLTLAIYLGFIRLFGADRMRME